MTTAHKPTFHPAIGRENQGGYEIIAGRHQKGARDMPGELTMKYRQEIDTVDKEVLKAKLQIQERSHEEKLITDRRRQGLATDAAEENIKVPQLLNTDMLAELKKFGDSDDEDSSDESSDSADDDTDEEAELERELKKIKAERESERRKQEKERFEKEKAESSNPLMTSTFSNFNDTFTLKRSWTQDTVFQNQAANEPKRKRRFINDTIRNDFHKKFMDKYVNGGHMPV